MDESAGALTIHLCTPQESVLLCPDLRHKVMTLNPRKFNPFQPKGKQEFYVDVAAILTLLEFGTKMCILGATGAVGGAVGGAVV